MAFIRCSSAASRLGSRQQPTTWSARLSISRTTYSPALQYRALHGQALYDHYLNVDPPPRFRERTTPFHIQRDLYKEPKFVDARKAKLSTPGLVEERKSLPAAPDGLERAFRSSQIGPGFWRNLRSYTYWAKETSQTVDQEQAIYMKDNAGPRIVDWLMAKKHMQTIESMQFDVKFSMKRKEQTAAVAEAHCIAASQDLTYFWSYLQAQKNLTYRQETYLAFLLNHLILSSVYWNNLNMDLAASRFLHAVSLDLPAAVLNPAGQWLIQLLPAVRAGTMAGTTISEQNVTALLDSMSKWRGNQDFVEFQRARFQLDNNDATAALRFFQRLDKDYTTEPSKFIERVHLRPKLKAAVFHFIVRTAQALQRDGATDNARWTLDFGHKLMPDMFTGQPTPATA